MQGTRISSCAEVSCKQRVRLSGRKGWVGGRFFKTYSIAVHGHITELHGGRVQCPNRSLFVVELVV